MNTPSRSHAVAVTDELYRQHLAELVDYALKKISDGPGRASQRKLAERLDLAPTMITRWLTRQADPLHLKLQTVMRLAEACELNLCSVVAWLRDGKEAALEQQRSFAQNEMSLKELASRLLAAVDAMEAPAVEPGWDCGRLQELVEQRRQEVGPVLFDAAAQALHAAQVLKKLSGCSALAEGEWEVLGQLLNIKPQELSERYGPAGQDLTGMSARISQPVA